MPAQWYRYTERQSGRYVRVAMEDARGERVRACARHAVTALEHLGQARVVWDDTRDISEHEAAALRLAGERSQLSRKDAAA